MRAVKDYDINCLTITELQTDISVWITKSVVGLISL